MISHSPNFKCQFLILFSLFLLFTKGYGQCLTLLWSDEFNGSSLSTANWNYNIGYPGVNNELETYTSRPQNITVSGGNLTITALKENYGGYNYTSGKIDSYGKQSFKYGRFEASIKLPNTQGLWPAFWMMPQNSVFGGWPTSGEIDIMEIQGSNPYLNFGTIHYGPNSNNATSSGTTFTSFSNLSEGFHTYAIEWKPDTISWYLDNHHFYTVTKSDIAPQNWPFNENFYFILNLAVGGWFGGNPDVTTVFPQSMEVDYVRVYSNPHTVNINGKDVALVNENYTYSISDPKLSSFQWFIPSGSTIVSGQGTNSMVMTWGTVSGLVSVITSIPGCGFDTSSISVPVFENSCNLIFDNFESSSKKLITYKSATGSTYNPHYSNPAPDLVNNSSTVTFYQRNPIQYDLLYYSTQIINNSVEYENGNKVLFMDLYSNAPVGTVINWQLENKQRTSQPYPSGRRSVFVGRTTKQNAWEKIKFVYSSTPDPSTAATTVDQFTFLFNPNSYTTHYYYLDNLIRFTANNTSCTTTSTAFEDDIIEDQLFEVSPNPAHDQIKISIQSSSNDNIKLILSDLMGSEVFIQNYTTVGSPFETTINISNLKPGVYVLSSNQGEKIFKTKKIIVQ